MADAMHYEYLIRKVYNCGRGGVHAAEADTYRRFERKLALYLQEKEAIETGGQRVRLLPLDQLAYEAGLATGEVVANLMDAIDKLRKDHDLTEEQIEQLEDITVNLLEPTKEGMEAAIDQLHPFTSNLGLVVG